MSLEFCVTLTAHRESNNTSMLSSAAAPICEEKRRLLVEYESAAQAYHQAMSELQTKIGVCPKPVYERVFQASEAARSESEAARTAFLKHVREHHC